MSPEQVRGEELDARTDLFSFGVMLYKMAAGVRPFRGETSGVIAEAILNRRPVAPVRLSRFPSRDGRRLLFLPASTRSDRISGIRNARAFCQHSSRLVLHFYDSSLECRLTPILPQKNGKLDPNVDPTLKTH